MPNAGAFKKGEKRPKQGRPPGKRNAHTTQLKEMILGALSDAGGQKYLAAQAKAEPKAFLTLLGRVLPMQVSGGDGESFVIIIKD